MKRKLFIIASILSCFFSANAQVVGSNDLTFNPGIGASSTVLSTDVQPDGKIIIGGGFTSYNGTSVNRLARINSNGTYDNTFNVGTGANITVYKVGVLASGKVFACGQFTTCNGAPARRIVRLNTNGTADNTFTVSTAANAFVYSFAEQSDAKIIIGGAFTTFAGTTRSRIARINTNGLNDGSFTPGTGANSTVYNISLQTDGKIVIGGLFTTYNGTATSRVARLNTNGTKDGTFVTGTGITSTSTNVAVYACAIQSDGKILVGGLFSGYNGSIVNNIVRLNTNGTIDNSFSVTGPNNYIRSIKVQPDGKIIVTGAFTTYNGVSKNRIARLNSDGTIDNTFNGTGSDNTILSTSLQSNGNIIISGDFTTYSGDSRSRIARINSTCPTLTLSSSQTDNLCNGSSSGSATVIATGGTSFTYSWLPTNTTSSVSSGLSAGIYSCIVTNECLNSSTISVTITEPSAISITTGASATICLGSNTVITATASGGSGPYTYNWIPGNLSGASQTVSPGSNTVYTVTATDSNGCNGLNTQNVSVAPLPTISISGGTAAICAGSSSTLTASGANSYSWNTGDNTADAVVTPSITTTYTVIGTDVNGCSNSATKTVTVAGTCATSTVPCGFTYTNMASSASAGNVTGAVNYRFKFYNSITNALVATKIQASRTLTFNSVSGLYYGNTYKWTVAVDKGTGFGAESNNSCLVTFAAPKTTVPCGNSYNSFNFYTTCPVAPGALNYRFSFYNTSTNALVAVKTQTSNYIYFNQVSGLTYGNTYNWTVEAQYNNGTSLVFGPASSNTCIIIFNPPKSTLPCGNSYSNFNTYTTCQSITGATNYRFSFYNSTTSALMAVKTQTSNYIYFNQVVGLAYGNTYNWTVEVEYNNGSGLVFGPPSSNTCTITFNPPQTTLACGNTYTNTTAYTTVPSVSGTFGYRFSFYDAATSALLAVKTQTSNYLYFNQVSGLIFNKNYKWTVEVQYYNGSSLVYGPASSNTCTMTWGTPAPIIINDDFNPEVSRFAQNTIDGSNSSPIINVFPNPTSGKVFIESSEPIKEVSVFNISGELIFKENSSEINLSNLKTGLYMITIETETQRIHSKIIKE